MLKEQIDKGEIWDKDNVIKLYDSKVYEAAHETFPIMLEAFIENQNTFQAGVIIPAREIVAESGLYITKKRYAALVYDVEGFRSDVDGKFLKSKAMGPDRVDLDIVDARVFERTANGTN